MSGAELIMTYVLMGIGALDNGGYVSVGAGMAPSINQPEVELTNPIFDGEVGISKGRYTLYVRHSSGIFYMEEGAGFNLIGIKYTFGKK